MAHQRRTGIPTLTYLAREMCRLITKFGPIIREISNNDPGVATALSAALAACSALDEKLQEYAEQGV